MANGNGLNGNGKSKDLVSISQAASMLGVSIDTVRRWDKAGTLRSSRPDGKNRYFSVDELEKTKLEQPLTISEAARMLKISPSTLRRLENKDLISPIRNGHGERRYDRQSLQKFLDSEYFIRQKEVEEEVLEPLKAQPEESENGKKPTNGQPGAELAVRHLVTEHHGDIHKLQRHGIFTLGLFGAVLLPIILLIAGLTAAFMISPESTAKSLGLITPTGGARNKYVHTSNWKDDLRPFVRTALFFVDIIDKQKYAVATQDLKLLDINSVFRPNKAGQVLSIYTLSLDSSKLSITDQGLIVNLNSDFLQGKKPGSQNGDIAVLPVSGGQGGEIVDGSITTFDIANGSITGEKLAPGLKLDSAVSNTTIVSGGSSINDIIVGNGLLGGGSSGSVSLSVAVGDGINLIGEAVSINLTTASSTATTFSNSGLEVSPSGLRLLGGCSDGQILKWNAITEEWFCAAASSGGGSLTVQESDGSPLVGSVDSIQFGPASSSSDEFIVTNQGSGSVRITIGNQIAKLNADQTFTGINTFSNSGNSFTGDGSGLTALDASNISGGTISDSNLSTNVTLQGNSFNGVSQLVQLTAGGILPILSGANLTNLNASNLTGTAAGLTVGTATNLAGGLGGQIPYQSAANTTAMLANGLAGQVLSSQGTTLAPIWIAAGGTGTVTSVDTAAANNGVTASWATTTTTPRLTIGLAAITPTSVNGLTLTAAATGFTIAGGTTSKTLTVSNTLTLAGTDASTLNIGAGGTLGSNAFTSGSCSTCLVQVPTGNSAATPSNNVVSPTAASVNGLTINSTNNAATGATAAIINQTLNVATASVDILDLNGANAANTIANGLFFNQTGAGTTTNGIQIKQTAGAITNGLTFTGTFTKLINSTNFNVSNAGTVTLATGQSYTSAGTVTLSSAAANGITIDPSGAGTASITIGGTNATTVAIGRTGQILQLKGVTSAVANGIVYIKDTNGGIEETAASTGAQCLQTSGAGTAPIWGACGGGGATLQTAYDASGGNTILTTTGRNIAFTLGEVATPTSFSIENQDTAGTSAERIFNSIASGTLTSGLLVEQTGAGTMTNAIQVLGTAGAITNGLLITDGAGTLDKGIVMTGTITTAILDTPSLDISGAGAITGATGVSTTTVTASSAIAANGGITFDNSTDTLGAFTLGGTLATGTQNITGTNFGITGSTGNFDTQGVIQAGSGNINITDATGNITLTSGDGVGGTSTGSGMEAGTGGTGLLQGCTDGQVLKWTAATSVWGCAADATGSGPTTKYLSANHANSTATGTKVTSLDTTLAPGTYTFTYSLIVQSATATTGPMFGINFSTGTAAVHTFAMRWADNSTVLTAYTDGMSGQGTKGVGVIAGMASRTFTTTAPDMGTTVGTATAASNTPAWIDGIIVVTVQGNLELWHSSETTTATTLMANSSVVITPITAGADLAEIYGTMDTSIGPGDVVSLDSSLKAGVKKSNKPYDANAFGVITTKPSLVMGTVDDPAASPVMVALSGRVPVKVTTENGPIKFGDLLTPSSTPGVAMRATKAGQIIGQAMSEFNGNGIGKVMAFVKTDYGNGGKLADLFTLGTDISSPDIGKQALAQLTSNSSRLISQTNLSEITTDRLMAGLEVIAPKVTTDNLALNTIKPIGVDITMELGTDGRFVIKNPAGQEAVAIDSAGNANFTGTVTADTIKANKIEGLEIYTGTIKSLSEQVAQLSNPGTQAIATSNSGSGNQSVLGATTGTGAPASNIIDLSNLNIQTATVALELNVGGMLYANGGLTINGLAQFNGQSVFNDLASFNGSVNFNGDIGFVGRATFNSDSGGFATIHNGQQEVKVKFDKPYTQVPAVTANIKNGQFAQYAYKDLDQNGFTIVLAQPATDEVEFAWVALSVKDARTAQVPGP